MTTPVVTDPTWKSAAVCCVVSVLSIPYSIAFISLASLALIEYVVCLTLRLLCCEETSRRHRPFCELAFVRCERTCRECVFNIARQLVEYATGFHGDIRRALLPSLQFQDCPEHKAYMLQCKEKCDAIKAEIEDSKKVLDIIRSERRERIQAAATVTGAHHADYTQPLGKQSLGDLIHESGQLRSHIEALEKDLRNIEHIAKTQVSADHTGYHGLAEWAAKMLENHRDPLEALCQVSFFGAGLTYSTIFGATRGNVGIMCYAFAFFNFGFIIPLLALALLKWTSSRHWDMIFATPHVWSVLLNVFVYVSVIAVAAAICMLSVTIILLHFAKDESGAYSDSPTQFDVEPRFAGASVMGCAIITVAMTLCAVGLHYMANGWSTLLSDFAGHRKDKPSRRFEDYILQ